MKGKNTIHSMKLFPLFNYIIPIIISLFVYIFYVYYKFLFSHIKDKKLNIEIIENFKNRVCPDNSCGMGCIKPKKITDKCPSTIYKDVDGKCHRKCPFICSNKSKEGCKYNDCCFGCGYTKIQVPCELSNDETSDDDSDNEEPLPNKDTNSTNHSNSKSKHLNNNMTSVFHKDIDFKGWSPFVKKWPCDLNVTGTFTECGPPAYNYCGV